MNLTAKWVAFGGKDCAALIELRGDVLRKPLGLEFTPEQLAQEAGELHLGLWHGHRAVGCCLLRDQGGVVRMRQVAVSCDLQGQGLGRILVAEAEAEAKRRGGKRMILHARDTVVGFYEKLGYGVEGELFVEVGLAHRRMAKLL